jgi:hypothetical protein
MGKHCEDAVVFLCRGVPFFNHMCQSLKHFALANKELGPESYCNASFEVEAEMLYCTSMLNSLADGNDEDCFQRQANLRQIGANVAENHASKAKLKVDIANLYDLWLEYDTGLDEHRAARQFTKRERNRLWYRRNLFWETIAARLKAGDTVKDTCEKIYSLYGQTKSVDDIVSAMVQDHQNGKLSADLTPAADLEPNPPNLLLLWEDYQNGLDGTKPARLFTPEERNSTYARWKIVLDIIAKRISSGDTAQIACDRIYKAYGYDRYAADIIKLIAADIQHGKLPPELA